MFLNGNFVALQPFKEKYGVLTADGTHSIETKWQSSLFQSGQCGAFVGKRSDHKQYKLNS